MKDEIIIITIVLGLACLLFLLRHFILTVGKSGKKLSLSARSNGAKRRSQQFDSSDERSDIRQRLRAGLALKRSRQFDPRIERDREISPSSVRNVPHPGV
jgi:hypothetical protein